jgi:hypothetical protein
VIFRLNSDVTLGSLQFDTDYSGAGGEFLGSAGTVQCSTLVDALYAPNDIEAESKLTQGLISLNGFDGPTNVSQCTFVSSGQPQPEDFEITVTEASDPNLTPITPLPDVIVVDNIDCGGPVTTTTLGPPTTTTTAGQGNTFNVVFTVASASASIGALQWTVDYETASGEFRDSGAAVKCVPNNALGALFAPNDVDAERELTLGLIALTPFTAPNTLVTCTFDGVQGDAPVPADFAITIDDATDANGEPITATINVQVTPAP